MKEIGEKRHVKRCQEYIISKIPNNPVCKTEKETQKCTEQNFEPRGRRWGWDVLREQHLNIYIIKGETDHQPRLNPWDKCLGLVHWEDPEGSGGEEVGGGIGMGNTCKSITDSCQCMAKTTTVLQSNWPPTNKNKWKKGKKKNYSTHQLPF